MANLGNFKIENKSTDNGWTDLTTLAGITKSVILQPKSNDCVLCEKATVPDADEGAICPYRDNDTYFLKGATTIWAKPYGPKSYVYINVNE